MTDVVAEPGEPIETNRLAHFPVAFFSVVMGLTGLAIAWAKAEQLFGLTVQISTALLMLAVLVFVAVAGLYGAKALRHPAAVRKELGHPLQLNFFPAISISLILLGIAMLHLHPGVAGVLWVLGTTLHLFLTLYVMGVWMHHDHLQIDHINPAWFIPVVGNVLVPIAGVPLGFVEVSWFFFSIGIVFWLLLFTIILYRVLFHHPLAERLMPTFFILIAPPAVGFLAYCQLTGEVDAFARVLYYVGLFLVLLLLTQISRFARIQYYLSWWAYSFPLAAISVASLVMFEQTRVVAIAAIAWLLLTLVTLVVCYLVYRTVQAMAAKGICVPVH
jgi:tellurite resistance protein